MSTDPTPDTAPVEDVEAFRARARDWIRADLGPLETDPAQRLARSTATDEEELAEVRHDRELQRRFYDAGFAGICVPREYGGQGLTPAHQRALNEELAGFEYPVRFQSPTMNPCLAVLLDFGTEAQKLAHVPAILRGDELWQQFLSEPTAGSDVAGALTTAVRDGDEWVLNGSKVWTTGAWFSDWGLCLARTNWDVPKHRGLTVFIFPIHQDGIEVRQIEMLNGVKDFCEEFITDLRVPDSDRVGEVDQGWTVGTRWMFHEKMLYNSPLVTKPVSDRQASLSGAILDVVRATRRLDDPEARSLLGEARTIDLVGRALQGRIATGMRTGTLSDSSSAIARLYVGTSAMRLRTIGLDLAGSIGAAWTDDDGDAGFAAVEYLMRQTSCIGGGTTEIARNVISERVLGMPREPTRDRDVPFRDVPRGRTGS